MTARPSLELRDIAPASDAGVAQRYDQHGRPIYTFDYPQLVRFMRSQAPVQVIQGPIGSGKSKACNLKAWMVAASQKPGPDGIRHTRGAVIRNTYGELISTTMRTWRDTFPEHLYGNIVMSKPARQIMRPKGTDVDAEVDFIAMDKEDDVKKLMSSEYTWVYINELQFIPKMIFDEVQSRVEMGRYPAMKDGGPTWHGMWCDMNAPADDHFIAVMTGQTEFPEGMSEDDRAAMTWPEEWDFIMQPPGLLDIIGPDGKPSGQYRMNPQAENIKYLAKDAYLKMIRGKTRPWIKTRVLNQIALVIDGDPVWPWFRRETYVAGRAIEPVKGHDLWVALDFGRKPAALIGQFINSRVVILDEMQAYNEGAVTFAPKVKARLSQRYAGFNVRFCGDPKGADKTQNDDRSAYDVWASLDMKVMPAPIKQNLLQPRIEAVEHLGASMYDGKPRLLISPTCRTLIVGMEGRYCYEKKANSEETRAEPKDNNYTHLCDCLQYLVLTMGEGRRMIGLTPIGNLRPVRVYRPKTMRRNVGW
jgi:hypothetical protein